MTIRMQLLYAQFIVVALLAIFHRIAIENNLYWHYMWLDLFAHTLGGMWAGLCVFWIRAKLNLRSNLAWVVVGALALGVAWELFEIAAGLPRGANYTLDTSFDVLMDAVGGILAGLLVWIASRTRAKERAGR